MVSFLTGCMLQDSKFVRKRIKRNNISIKWCYYSYITNNSPDIVLVEKDGHSKEIFRANNVISDVNIQDQNIILRLVKPSHGIVFTKNVDKEVFGYKISLDTTGVEEEMRFIPNGIKEDFF